MHTSEIIWLFVWPAFIAVVYLLAFMAVRKFEKKQNVA